MAQRRIPIADLAIGMYVSALDRPWIETPFLFQGFTIHSHDEIDELARYCQQIVIDDDGPPSPGAESSGAPSAQGEDVPGQFYRDRIGVEEEAPKAKAVHQQASEVIEQAMQKVRGGGSLDVEELDAVVSPMMESVLRNQDAMAWLTRIRQTGDYTYGHAVSCSIYAIAFGRHLGLPREDLQVLGLGALLFDIGKTRIPQALLNKKEPLSEQELALMRRHVDCGLQILRDAGSVEERVLAMVRSHHERYDGSGYPGALKGPEIPVFARIAGIVDFYHAVTTERPYAQPISAYHAMRYLQRRAKEQFQREMVDHFVQAIGMFPNGALVELSTGEVGVVVEQNRLRRLRPKVLLILDADKKPLARLRSLDLREQPGDHRSTAAVWIERGLEAGAYGIDSAEFYL